MELSGDISYSAAVAFFDRDFDFDERYVESVAYHEAAHVVIAVVHPFTGSTSHGELSEPERRENGLIVAKFQLRSTAELAFEANF